MNEPTWLQKLLAEFRKIEIGTFDRVVLSINSGDARGPRVEATTTIYGEDGTGRKVRRPVKIVEPVTGEAVHQIQRMQRLRSESVTPFVLGSYLTAAEEHRLEVTLIPNHPGALAGYTCRRASTDAGAILLWFAKSDYRQTEIVAVNNFNTLVVFGAYDTVLTNLADVVYPRGELSYYDENGEIAGTMFTHDPRLEKPRRVDVGRFVARHRIPICRRLFDGVTRKETA